MNVWTAIKERARDRQSSPAEARGIYDLHPELRDRVPILRALANDESAKLASLAPYREFYTGNTWVHKAIKVLADGIMKLDLQVVKKTETDFEVVEDHPLMELFNSPNPEQAGADFWEEWVILMMIGGECGLELTYNRPRTRIVEMWLRDPASIIIVPGANGYRYRRVSRYKIDDDQGDPYTLAPDELIHTKFFNPLNPWRGISPLAAVRTGVIIDELAQAWAKLFFKNQARPDFAVIAPTGITKSEKDTIKEELSRQHSQDHAHEPVVLEDGVTDIKVFSYPPKDLEWLEQRKFSRDEIGAIFGVPDEVMGYGKDTYENFDQAQKFLWTITIVPLVAMRDRVVSHKLRRLGFLKPGEQIMSDLSPVPQLQEDRKTKVDQLAKLADRGYPVNLLNAWLDLGLPLVQGGNVGYLPMNMMPVTATEGEELPTPPQQPAPTTPPEESPSSPAAPSEEETPPSRSLKQAFPIYGSTEHAELWKLAQDRIDPFVEVMQRVLKKEFQRQQSEIDRKLRASRDFGRGRFKDEGSIPPVESLFNSEDEIKRFLEALGPVVTDAIQASGAYGLGQFVPGGIFDITNPLVQASINEILTSVATKVNNTTFTDLIELFQEAEKLGEGIPAIQERLSSYFGDRKSDWQTERIARTTMTGAANLGTLQGWQQSGVNPKKGWLSALIPGRTRDEHSRAHGQIVGLQETFNVGGERLMYPGDPTGSPTNIINCLCSMRPIVED